MSYLPIEHTATNVALDYFKKKFAWTPRYTYTYDEWKATKKRYAKWKICSAVLALTMMFVLMVAYAGLFWMIYKFLFSLVISNGTFYPINWMIFLISGLFLSLGTLIWWVEHIQRLLLVGDYDAFEDYYNIEQGYDNHKAGIWIAKIGILVTLLTLPVTFTNFIALENNGITIKSIGDYKIHAYGYNEIYKAVYYKSFESKDGMVTAKPLYMVYFKDGNSFSPGFYFNETEDAAPFFSDLSIKGKIFIDTAEVRPFNYNSKAGI